MSLDGRRIVVTRRPAQAGTLVGALEAAGADVIALPTIAIEPPPSWAEVDDSIRKLAQGAYDWVAFTSANAVEAFCSRLGCMPQEVFKTAKVAAVGPATAGALAERDISVDLVPESYTAVAVGEALGEGSGSTILLPRAAEVPPDLTDRLRGSGWVAEQVAVYRTVPCTDRGPEYEAVERGDFDTITFASASAVKAFLGIGFPIDALGLVEGTSPERTVACIGPVTADECRSHGLRVDVVARDHTVDGLVSALTVGT